MTAPPRVAPSAEEMNADLDKLHKHIQAFKEYGQPLPQALLDKLEQVRMDALAEMHAQD